MILITSGTVELPRELMEETIRRNCRIHCHDADAISERMRREKATQGDVTITLTWDTVDDLDLHVFVPDRSEVSYANREAMGGRCVLDVDMNACSPYSKEPVENVFLGDLDRKVEAPLGKYKVVVQNYSYHSDPSGSPVPFQVAVSMNGKKESYYGTCVGQGAESNVVVLEFEYSGRTIPFPGDEKDADDGFTASNLINLTSSSGQTIESLSNLLQAAYHQSKLEEARQLATDPEAAEPTTADDDGSPAVTAGHGTLYVTNRDRHTMLLAKLPRRFHAMVAEAYGGGPSLVEECALEIATRMLQDKVPINQLASAGYPEDIVAAVKQQLVAAAAAAGSPL